MAARTPAQKLTDLDDLLTVLRRHRVLRYEDDMGVKLELSNWALRNEVVRGPVPSDARTLTDAEDTPAV